MNMPEIKSQRAELSQKKSQHRQNEPETGRDRPGDEDRPLWIAPKISKRPTPSKMLPLVEHALAVRCPICRTRVGRYCSGAAYEEPRRRIGRELLHVARINLGAVADETRSAERAALSAQLHSAPTETPALSSRPRPAPPTAAPLPPRGSGLRTTLDDRVRASLRSLDRHSEPGEIRTALASAGLMLPISVVEQWISTLHDDDERSTSC